MMLPYWKMAALRILCCGDTLAVEQIYHQADGPDPW